MQQRERFYIFIPPLFIFLAKPFVSYNIKSFQEKHEHEATKNKMAELSRKFQTTQDETELVRQERDLVREKVNEERARGNILERQLADKQNLCSELMKKSVSR